MTDIDDRSAPSDTEPTRTVDDSLTTEGKPAPRGRRWLLPAGLGVILTVLLGTSAWLYWGDPGVDESPVAVARQEAANFFTLDYSHADADLARVLDLAADPFKQQYAAQQAAVKGGLVDKKLTMSAAIPDNGTAIEYEHGDNAQVLVAVNATTRDVSGASQVNRYRVRVQLARSGGQWRVSQFNQVG